MTAQQVQTINGVDTQELQELINAVEQDATQGQCAFHANTAWVNGSYSQTQIKSFDWANQSYSRDFTLTIDEPEELGGTNRGPNPQEVLLAGVNTCIMVTFVELCSMEGIKLESLEINSTGRLDLRGMLKLDENIPPGYQDLHWVMKVKGDGTPEQFQQIYEETIATSPNFWNMANPVKIQPELQVES